MSTADQLDDRWPYTHGTVEGYDQGGCKGAACPAGVEHGLSCKLAKALSRNDYRYSRLVRDGATPAAIAAEFDLIGTAAAAAPTTKRAPRKPRTIAKPHQPAAAPPVAPEPVAPTITTASPSADPAPPVAASQPTPANAPTTAEIREWARQRGYELTDRGPIPRHIREHFDKVRSLAPHRPRTPPHSPIDPPNSRSITIQEREHARTLATRLEAELAKFQHTLTTGALADSLRELTAACSGFARAVTRFREDVDRLGADESPDQEHGDI